MTITSEAPRRIDYTGATGAETVFPYPFVIFASSDLAVYQDAGLLSEGTHYTVSGVGLAAGGNVTLGTALPIGSTLTILSDVPGLQPTHFSEGTRFPAATVEALADRLVVLYQQGRMEQARALRVGVLSTFDDLTVPDPVALRGLRWRSDLTGLENVDLTTLLPGAATLPLDVTQGGTSATTALGARVALGVDGQVRKTLTNQSGIGLAAGDVVTLNAAHDSSVTLDDTTASKGRFVIALEPVGVGALGQFLLAGIATVKVTGTVVRGRYARKAASLTAVDDSGVAATAANDPPPGALGVFLTGGAGSVTVEWFGFTYPGSPAAPVIPGLARIVGGAGGNANAAPTTQFDYAAVSALVRDPVGGGTLVLPAVANRTCDITVAGPAAGGRDQGGAFNANAWLHLYLIAKTDGTYHLTASLAAPPTGPTLPSGYTLWAYAGAVRFTNSSELARVRLRGAWTLYEAAQAVVSDGRATVETAVSVASLVPPLAPTWSLHCTGYHQTNASQWRIRVVSGQEYTPLPTIAALASTARFTDTLPNVAQQFFYLVTQDQGATTGLNAYVRGYENPTG